MAANNDAYGTMLSPELASARLKERGERMTAQRHVVLDILHNNRSHPTAESIIAQVKDRLGCVSTATIYNTLDVLEKLGFVRRLEGLEQRAHFDPDTSDHQHSICRVCKRVWDIESPAFMPELPSGFRAEDVIIQGICKDCTSLENNS